MEIRNSVFPNTENITKEQFKEVQPKKFTSKIDSMQDILKLFNIDIAETKRFFHIHLAEIYFLTSFMHQIWRIP